MEIIIVDCYRVTQSRLVFCTCPLAAAHVSFGHRIRPGSHLASGRVVNSFTFKLKRITQHESRHGGIKSVARWLFPSLSLSLSFWFVAKLLICPANREREIERDRKNYAKTLARRQSGLAWLVSWFLMSKI